MAITTRVQRRADIPNIVTLYNLIVDQGGYSLADPEFDRHITSQDWLDWEVYRLHVLQLVFEQDGAFFGFCALSEETPTEVTFEHLGVFETPVPEEIMWQIVDWLKANTSYVTLAMETADLTNASHFNSLADTLGAETIGTLRRKILAEAQRPPRRSELRRADQSKGSG